MIVVKKIRPIFTDVYTTAEMLEEKDMYTSSGLIDPTKQRKTIKEFQRVIAVGPHVNGINVGDLVCVNPTRFGKPYQKKNSMNAATEEYETMVHINLISLKLMVSQSLNYKIETSVM